MRMFADPYLLSYTNRLNYLTAANGAGDKKSSVQGLSPATHVASESWPVLLMIETRRFSSPGGVSIVTGDFIPAEIMLSSRA
jgi:hypothetical protein